MAMRAENPYRPGYNQPPVVFVGRSDVLDGATEALEIAAYDGRTPRALILLGPRGVGKTVTLGEIRDLAATKHSWPAVHADAKAGGRLLGDLTKRVRQAGLALEGKAPQPRPARSRVSGAKVGAQVFGIGGEIEIERDKPGGRQDDLESALVTTMATAIEKRAGLVITIDEIQNAEPAELAELFGTLQERIPDGWPLVLAVAALPTLRESQTRRRLPTYLERAEWHDLDTLPPGEARLALVSPAERAGRPMTPAAADLLLAVTGGYPYAIQVAGHFSWRASDGARAIGVEHARLAIPRVEADLTQLFRARWDDASPREKEYLSAMAAVAEGGQEPRGGAVAAQMGMPVKAVSYLRSRLLRKGTIYRQAGGALHFITPGMGAWIRSLDQEN
jgi:hypothetical protein